MAIEQREVTTIGREQMTSVLEGSRLLSEPADLEEGDIPVEELTGTADFPTGSYLTREYPEVIPESPRFTVPANPLLPEGYSEVLDYNAIQYMNGFFRTQIGRYVKVEQLVGSNTIEEYDGFLVGVGINYITLQEYSVAAEAPSSNIRILDIYGIKNMYVYYANIINPITGEAT